MDQLFAPWRIEWVKRDRRADADGCPFCELPESGNDRDALVVARGEHGYVLLNNSPYNPGHAMVIPYRHVGSYRALEPDELLDCERLVQRTLEAFETALDPDGFNTGCNLGGAGGGSIEHVHRHVVPRWRGDTNFMAVIDETNVIVQALEDTYDVLRKAFAEQEGTTKTENGAVRIDRD